MIGSGAREHAIVKALMKSTKKPRVFCFGTHLNPGIAALTFDYSVGDITDVVSILANATKWHITHAIIGPEAPLAKGLADVLWMMNIKTIGPKQSLARIESSKAYARDLMQQHVIQGLPRYQVFHALDHIHYFLNELGENNYVIKANGLMSGKGVKVAGEHLHSFQEALMFCEEIIKSGQAVVIEEKLVGQEFSLMCFCDGKTILPMPIVQDHKRAHLHDQGPNTGGMGSYSDANHSLPFLTVEDVKNAQIICEKVMQALMNDCQEKYIGIIYGGFIATRDGVSVIEFNARFGDPESLNVLAILKNDFVDVCEALVEGSLANIELQFLPQATVCKYAVPRGYPEQPVKNLAIDISAVKNKTQLYLASVHAEDNIIYAQGSRTAAYVGVADTIALAEIVAEQEISAISGPLYHRTDIGTAPLIASRLQTMRDLRAEK